MIAGTSLVVLWLRLCLPMQGEGVQSLVRELRSHVPHGQKIKTQNRSNTVANSIKALKMVHIKKKKQKKTSKKKKVNEDFPGGTKVDDPCANAGDRGSISALGRSHMQHGN